MPIGVTVVSVEPDGRELLASYAMTIVIMLGIVLMWAVVLIPMWLRRHDEVEESRSLDRFSTAMHTLSRREPESADKKYLVMPHRTRSLDVHVSGGAAYGGDRTRRSATEVRAEKMARAAERARRSGPISPAAAARRRRTLLTLVFAAVVTFVAWFLVGGLLVLAVQLLSDIALVAFLWSLRGSGSSAAAPVSEPRRRPAPARAPARTASRPVRRSGSLYDDYGHDMYDDADWQEVPVPSRTVAAATAPRRQASELFDQSALDDRVGAGVHDAWLDEPTYSESPRYVAEPAYLEEPQYFELPRAEPARERTVDQVAPSRSTAPSRRRTAPVEPAAERTRGRRTIDSRRSSVSDRIASYSKDLEVDAVRPSRAPRPAAASEHSIGARPWEPVPVPRPVYTTKPAAPRRTPRAPMPEPLPPTTETAATASPEELEEILDRRWAVND